MNKENVIMVIDELLGLFDYSFRCPKEEIEALPDEKKNQLYDELIELCPKYLEAEFQDEIKGYVCFGDIIYHIEYFIMQNR